MKNISYYLLMRLIGIINSNPVLSLTLFVLFIVGWDLTH